jgi:hypothetical protein
MKSAKCHFVKWQKKQKTSIYTQMYRQKLTDSYSIRLGKYFYQLFLYAVGLCSKRVPHTWLHLFDVSFSKRKSAKQTEQERRECYNLRRLSLLLSLARRHNPSGSDGRCRNALMLIGAPGRRTTHLDEPSYIALGDLGGRDMLLGSERALRLASRWINVTRSQVSPTRICSIIPHCVELQVGRKLCLLLLMLMMMMK